MLWGRGESKDAYRRHAVRGVRWATGPGREFRRRYSETGASASASVVVSTSCAQAGSRVVLPCLRPRLARILRDSVDPRGTLARLRSKIMVIAAIVAGPKDPAHARSSSITGGHIVGVAIPGWAVGDIGAVAVAEPVHAGVFCHKLVTVEDAD